MTDKKTEALRLALEALEYISSHYMSLPKIGCMALAAVEEALAEQCVCGEPDTPGTHRTDGPCLAEQPAQPQCPHDFLMGDDEPGHDSVCMQCGAAVPNDEPAQQQEPVAFGIRGGLAHDAGRNS